MSETRETYNAGDRREDRPKYLLCTFDEAIDLDILKNLLRGKRGWLSVKIHPAGTQFFIEPPTDDKPRLPGL